MVIFDMWLFVFFNLQVYFMVILYEIGQFCIIGVKYSFSSVVINGLIEEKFFVLFVLNFVMIVVSILGRFDLLVKGLRLNNIKVEKISVIYGKDN